MRQFPEATHTKHQPTGEKPGYSRSSQSIGAGHMDHPNRMEHPQQQPVPMKESGEGLNK